MVRLSNGLYVTQGDGWWCGGVIDRMSSRKGQDDVSVMVLHHTHDDE